MQGLKRCAGCKQDLPPDAFEPMANGRLRSRCIPCQKCREEERAESKELREKPCDPRLAAIEQAAVDTLCAVAAGGGGVIPHAAELVESIYAGCNGVHGLTKLMWKQYFDAAPGGAHRTKILAMIMQLTANNSDAGGARKPHDLMDEDELKADLRRQILLLRVQDGTAQKFIESRLADERDKEAE